MCLNMKTRTLVAVLFGVLITRALLTAESGLAQQPSAGWGADLDTLAQGELRCW